MREVNLKSGFHLADERFSVATLNVMLEINTKRD